MTNLSLGFNSIYLLIYFVKLSVTSIQQFEILMILLISCFFLFSFLMKKKKSRGEIDKSNTFYDFFPMFYLH